MPQNEIVSREQWVAARKELLLQEKEFTKLRNDLSSTMDWVRHYDRYGQSAPSAASG